MTRTNDKEKKEFATYFPNKKHGNKVETSTACSKHDHYNHSLFFLSERARTAIAVVVSIKE